MLGVGKVDLGVGNINVLDVEANIFSGNVLGQGFVMHLNELDFSGDVSWSENNNAARFQDSDLNSTDGYYANTGNFVDILQGQTQGLVGGMRWGQDGVDQSLALSIGFLALNLASLESWHVGGGFQHVVAVPAGNGRRQHRQDCNQSS